MKPMLGMLLGASVWLLGLGCSGTCAEAKDLCEVCEQEASRNCDRFDDLSSDDCDAAITTYEANCPEAQ